MTEVDPISIAVEQFKVVIDEFEKNIALPVLKAGYEAANGTEATLSRLLGDIRDEIFAKRQEFFHCLGEILQLNCEREEAVKKVANLIASERMDHECEIVELKKKIKQLEWRLQSRRLQEHSPASPEIRAKVFDLTDGLCAYCGTKLAKAEDPEPTFVIEHVVPKSCGGPDHLNNYVAACPTCNAQKASGHVVDFIRKRVGGA